MRYVKDLMTTEVHTLQETETLQWIRPLMQSKRIRHIPIINPQRQLTGLVTQRDLLAVAVMLLGEEGEHKGVGRGIPIAKVMRTDVQTVTPETELLEAAQLLWEHKYGCLPVVNAHRELLGIITEADFLRLTIQLLGKQAQ